MLDILQHKCVKTMKENVNEVKLLPVLGINVFLQKKKRNWVANTKWNSTMSYDCSSCKCTGADM